MLVGLRVFCLVQLFAVAELVREVRYFRLGMIEFSFVKIHKPSVYKTASRLEYTNRFFNDQLV